MLRKKLGAVATLVFAITPPAQAETVGLICNFIEYKGPSTGYDKFETVDGGLIDLTRNKVDLVSTRLNDMWSYSNGEPGSTAAGDQIILKSNESEIYGAGFRFGSPFAFEFNRKSRILVWTSVWVAQKAAQSYVFGCNEGRAPRLRVPQ